MARNAFTDAADKAAQESWKPVTPNLFKFSGLADSFQYDDFLQANLPDTEDRCPWADQHTEQNASGFKAYNADGLTAWGCNCFHSCGKDAARGMRHDGKQDRLKYLDAHCQKLGIKDAAELLEWCDDKTRADWKKDAKPIADTGPRVLKVRSLDMFKTKKLHYLCDEMLPLGLLSLFVGHTGVAKSLSAIHMAACITRGLAFKRGDMSRMAAKPVRPPADVVIVAGEDLIEQMLRPRAEAAGVDLSRVHVVLGVDVKGDDGVVSEQRFELERAAEDLAVLLASDRGKNVRLVIIDPINEFIGKVDAHRNNEVRDALNPLVKLAQKHNIAILMVHHCNKNAKLTSPLEAVSGSTAFAELPKYIAMLAQEDRGEPEGNRFIFEVSKNSNDRPGERYLYEIETVMLKDSDTGEEIKSARFNILENEEASPIYAALRGTGTSTAQTDIDNAAEWLLQAIPEDGHRDAAEVIEEGEALGHSKRTLQRARDKNDMQTRQKPARRDDPERGWLWFGSGVTKQEADVRAARLKLATVGGGLAAACARTLAEAQGV